MEQATFEGSPNTVNTGRHMQKGSQGTRHRMRDGSDDPEIVTHKLADRDWIHQQNTRIWRQGITHTEWDIYDGSEVTVHTKQVTYERSQGDVHTEGVIHMERIKVLYIRRGLYIKGVKAMYIRRGLYMKGIKSMYKWSRQYGKEGKAL